MISIRQAWGIIPLVWFLLAGQAFADGKMYSREKVSTTIPYQRAAILFKEGVETLILQSQYQIPGNQEKVALGWVVPVPAPPEIASMSARSADMLFSNFDWISAPKVTTWGLWILMVVWSVSLVLAVISFTLSWFSKLVGHRRMLRRVALAGVVTCIGLFLIAPLLIRNSKGAGGVEIIKTQKAGIFDVTVIRADSSAGLIDWLNRNSFKFGPEDEKAFQSYLDRKWCFVAAKIDPQFDPSNPLEVSSKLLAPLVLRFPTEKPVYPTSLTATGGHATEILIYLITDEPMKTDAPPAMRFRGPLDGRQKSAIVSGLMDLEPDGFLENSLLDFKFLSKFKATLGPAQMERDIEFHPDPGGREVREHLHKF